MEKFSLRILSALLALAAGACTYPFQAELDEMEDVLVVEGNIVIGSRSTIALSKMVPLADLGASDAAYPEDPTYYEKTALRSYSVRIEGEDGSRVEAEGDNPYTLDKIHVLTVFCSGIEFPIAINDKDLYGHPEPGRRFKGVIWLQGIIRFPGAF